MGDSMQTGLNPWNIELASQQQDIDRRRQMLTALLMNSMRERPTQMAGNIAIRQSPLGAIGNILTAGLAQKGISGLSDEEKALVQHAQDQSAQSMQELGQAAQYQPGTNTTINEEAGPPDEQGKPSVSVYPGKAGGIDSERFYKAYGNAQGKVDPRILADMLSQFNDNRTLLSNPRTAKYVPGFAGSQAQPTTGTTTQGGVSLSIPAANAGATPGGGAPAGGGQSGAPGAGASGPGIPDEAMGLMLTNNPRMQKVGAAMEERTRPVNLRPEGTVVLYDENGIPYPAYTSPKLPAGTRLVDGKVVSIPGVENINAQRLSRDEGIKADIGTSHQMATMKMPDGSEVQVPLSVALQLTGGKGAQAPAPQNVPPQTNPAATDAQAVAALRANGGQTVNFTPDGQQIAPAAPAAPAIGRSQTTADKSFQEAYGGDVAKRFSAYDDSGTAATTGRATVAQMKDALQAFEPNAGAPARLKLAEAAQALGMKDDSVKKIAGGDISAMQEFNKLAFSNSVTGLRSLVGPGQRISQMEMMTNYAQSPNPSIQKAAISTMLEMQDGGYRWAQDRQQSARAWLDAGKPPGGFDGWWNRNHPLTGKDDSGEPYIPTLDQVRARMDAAKTPTPTTGLGSRQVAGAIGSGPSPAKTVMHFDAQGNLVQ